MRFLLILALLLTACSGDKGDIADVLEARDNAISQRNIEAYASLLSTGYLNTAGIAKVEEMKAIFQRFENVEMTSRDREIRILDETSAICEQTYLLRVFADKQWREVVQREQLKLTHSDGHWKISGGL